MPDFKPYMQRYMDRLLPLIGQAVYSAIGDVEITAWCTAEPVPYAQRCSGQELHLKVGDKWGDLFDCAWFRVRGQIPESAGGQTVVLLLDVNGEMCVVDETGTPLAGLTNGSSVFDYSLGAPGIPASAGEVQSGI